MDIFAPGIDLRIDDGGSDGTGAEEACARVSKDAP